jgi:hypothetical protein
MVGCDVVVGAPFGLLFALRILWEKTSLTARQGPQMIGFSLAHLHPELFLPGVASCFMLIAWLIPALIFVILKKGRLASWEYAMLAGSIVAALAMFLPDDIGLTMPWLA